MYKKATENLSLPLYNTSTPYVILHPQHLRCHYQVTGKHYDLYHFKT